MLSSDRKHSSAYSHLPIPRPPLQSNGMNFLAAAIHGQTPIWKQRGHADTTELIGVQDYHLQCQVSEVVAYAAEYAIGDLPVAHFRIFLVLSEGRGAIQLNSKAFESHTTMLVVKYCSYDYSKSRGFMGTMTIPVIQAFTVREALEKLLSLNRDHYRLVPQTGSGCRYWCSVVIADFIQCGWLYEGYADLFDRLASALKKDPRWRDVVMPSPSPRGTFY
ncbi:hypothetical protein M413DRAFT_31933 [Hebeloma cylindrosporum]|uniref:DUF7770 domain-containing protein n=1 Tax=Hebeloma cylindrosporum TaxID=76867 RepID=A0A0C2Y564_HEBCY|nr:hypothetical protein M413DRAFT_31933 [Hebeloma cylindrosporum h7]